VHPHPPATISDDAALLLGRAVAGVAHDMRQVFQGLLDLLAEADEGPELTGRVRIVVAAGEAMTADMLALAGLGPAGLQPWPLPKARALLETWCAPENLHLEGLTNIRLDELRSVANLVANARAAAGRGGHVALRVTVQEGRRHWACDNEVRTAGGGGHGLGLALVAAFCREADGHIETAMTDARCTVRLDLPDLARMQEALA